MNYNDLIYFKDVYELNSFTKAAEKNFIAQTAVSHSVKRFEKEIGTPLLVRKRGQIELTLAGRLVYQDILTFIQMREETSRKIAKLKEKKTDITIGYIDAYEWKNFSELQRRLEVDFPDQKFQWVDKYSISDKECDIEIGYNFEFSSYSQFNTYKLGDERFGFLISRENPLAEKKEIYLEDLRGQTIIFLVRNRGVDAQRMRKQIQKLIFKEVEITIQFVYSAMERRCLVECGKGIGIVEAGVFRYDEKVCREVPVGGGIRLPLENWIVCRSEDCVRYGKYLRAFLEEEYVTK